MNDKISPTSIKIIIFITAVLIIFEINLSISLFQGLPDNEPLKNDFLTPMLFVVILFFIIVNLTAWQFSLNKEDQYVKKLGSYALITGIIASVVIILHFASIQVAKNLYQKEQGKHTAELSDRKNAINSSLYESMNGTYNIIGVDQGYTLPYIVLDGQLSNEIVYAHNLQLGKSAFENKLFVYPQNIDPGKLEEFMNFSNENLIGAQVKIEFDRNLYKNVGRLDTAKRIDGANSSSTLILPAQVILVGEKNIVDNFIFKPLNVDEIYDKLDSKFKKEELLVTSLDISGGNKNEIALTLVSYSKFNVRSVYHVYLKDKSCLDFKNCFSSDFESKIKKYIAKNVLDKKVKIVMPSREVFIKDMNIFSNNAENVPYGDYNTPAVYPFVPSSVILENGANLAEEIKSL